MNCVNGLVPALPERDHIPNVADCQLALPDASVVRTYQFDAPVVRRNPVNAPVHATSSLYPGVLVQIPTAPVEVIIILAVSLGPIIVDHATLLEILLPNADAPEAVAVFR